MSALIVPGSNYPDPGGMRAAGTKAKGSSGGDLVWNGASWDAFSTSVGQALVSGAGIVNSRDGMGRVTSFVVGDITYSVTYDNFGVGTISGGGQIMTVNRSASGLVTSVTTV